MTLRLEGEIAEADAAEGESGLADLMNKPGDPDKFVVVSSRPETLGGNKPA